MEIHICDGERIVEIWLNNSEKNDMRVRQSLQPIFDEYKCKKYKVAVFESGSGDLADNTAGLLLHNRVP